MVRWWWPGLDVREDELVRELDEMDRLGIGGAELQPFAIGLPANLAKTDPPRAAVGTHRFMQPFHYQMMQRVVDEAGKRGMSVDITQNSAWPTGVTHIPAVLAHYRSAGGFPQDAAAHRRGADNRSRTASFVAQSARLWKGRVPPLRPLRLYAFFGRVIPLLAKGLNTRSVEYIPEDKRLLNVVAGRCVSKPGAFGSWKVKSSTQLDLESMVDLVERLD